MKIIDYPSVLDPDRKVNMAKVGQIMESVKKLMEMYKITFTIKPEEEPKPLDIIKNKRHDD